MTQTRVAPFAGALQIQLKAQAAQLQERDCFLQQPGAHHPAWLRRLQAGWAQCAGGLISSHHSSGVCMLMASWVPWRDACVLGLSCRVTVSGLFGM